MLAFEDSNLAIPSAVRARGKAAREAYCLICLTSKGETEDELSDTAQVRALCKHPGGLALKLH